MFDELPFWSNGKGVVNKRRRRLYLFDCDQRSVSCSALRT